MQNHPLDEAESAYTDSRDKFKEALRSGDKNAIAQAKEAYSKARQDVNDARSTFNKDVEDFMAKEQAAGRQAKDTRRELAEDDEKAIAREVRGEKVGNFFKEAGEKAASAAVNNASPSASAKRDIAANVTGQPAGNVFDAKAAMLREASDQSNKQSAQHGMEAQQHQQIANRNEFGEGDKKAAAAQAADVKQKINAAGAHGNQAGLLRMQDLNPDYDREQERQDQQRTQAEQQREKQSAARKTAIAERGTGEQHNITSRDYNNDVDESARLSGGEGGKDEQEAAGDTGQKEEASAGQEQAQQEQATEQAAEQEQQEQQPAEPEQPAMEGYDYDTVQTAYNIYAGVRDPYMDKVQRYTAERKAEIEPKVNELAGKMKSDTSVAKKYGEWLPMARGQIAGINGPYNAGISETSALAQKGGKTTVMEDNNSTKSDERVKDVRKPLSREFWEELTGYDRVPEFKVPKDLAERQNKVLSDARCKYILESFENGNGIDDEDIDFLNRLQGNKFSFNGKDYDTGSMDSWDDSVLDGYAEHIKNYLYTYKPEAQSLDPEDEQLDPNQEHIGPMAQDIEQVNPACVKETPEGVKTVDTARLAMMNAGAIGDLARELKELKAVLGGL